MTKRRDGEGVLQALLITHPAKNWEAQAFRVQLIQNGCFIGSAEASGSRNVGNSSFRFIKHQVSAETVHLLLALSYC